MILKTDDILRINNLPHLDSATLVLAFSGWMDGGDVSTGTVARLIDLLSADPVAEIDAEPFYIYNFPGSMEITAMFRPAIEIEDGLIKSIDMPSNVFFCHEPANLLLFLGKEPNLYWQSFGECIFEVTRKFNVQRILFVGSFGGSVPHTRQPRLYITCSDEKLLPAMEKYGVRRSSYEGPGSFTSYLLSRAPSVGLEMTSLVAEIPGYLQGSNPTCIEAVTRRLAHILSLSVDLDELRSASTEWEFRVSSAIDENEELAEKIRELEESYDDDLLEFDSIE